MTKIKIKQIKSRINAPKDQKATILALSQMRDAYTVAAERGIGMEKVFNG